MLSKHRIVEALLTLWSPEQFFEKHREPRPWLCISSTFEAPHMYARVTCIGVGLPMQHST